MSRRAIPFLEQDDTSSKTRLALVAWLAASTAIPVQAFAGYAGKGAAKVIAEALMGGYSGNE
jgi:hypothetical protein